MSLGIFMACSFCQHFSIWKKKEERWGLGDLFSSRTVDFSLAFIAPVPWTPAPEPLLRYIGYKCKGPQGFDVLVKEVFLTNVDKL